MEAATHPVTSVRGQYHTLGDVTLRGVYVEFEPRAEQLTGLKRVAWGWTSRQGIEIAEITNIKYLIKSNSYKNILFYLNGARRV